MIDRLAKLADLAYRRRGPHDRCLAGSESAAARDITEREFGGYTAQQVYVAWRDPAGAARPEAWERIERFLAEAKRVDHVAVRGRRSTISLWTLEGMAARLRGSAGLM